MGDGRGAAGVTAEGPPQALVAQWPAIRRLFWRAFLSSVHYAIASVDERGDPHVTPIGTVILRPEPGRAIFFQRFTSALPANVERHAKVCVLAVDSGRLFWVRSLLAGRFPSPPAVRLYGTVGPLRPATVEEIGLWQRRVWPSKWTRGYGLIWKDMRMVRELRFTHAKGMSIGPMPADLSVGA